MDLDALLTEVLAAQAHYRRVRQGKFFIAVLKSLMVWFFIVLLIYGGHMLGSAEFYKALGLVFVIVSASAGGVVFLMWLVSGGKLFQMLEDDFKPPDRRYSHK